MAAEQLNKTSPGRRSFLWVAGMLSTLGASVAVRNILSPAKKTIISCGPEAKNKMVKMLAPDGSLVAVDASLIKSTGKKISDTELQNWVSR